MDSAPVLLRDYALFCKYRSDAMASGDLDLSGLDFIFPTTFLPLIELVMSGHTFRILPPNNPAVAAYLEFMLVGKAIPGGPRMPLRELPKERSKADELIGQLAASQNQNNVCCGESAFKYFLGVS